MPGAGGGGGGNQPQAGRGQVRGEVQYNSGLVRRRMVLEVNLACYGEIFLTPLPADDKRVVFSKTCIPAANCKLWLP